jgi:hypothetical protein
MRSPLQPRTTSTAATRQLIPHQSYILATLTSTSASAWPSGRLDALRHSLDVLVISDAPAIDASHLQRITGDQGILEAAKAVWLTACDPSASSVVLTRTG